MTHTINEVCELTGKGRADIYLLLNRGELRYTVAEDGQRRIASSELERLFGIVPRSPGDAPPASAAPPAEPTGDALHAAHEADASQTPRARRPMDIVYIQALEIETVIGIYDWERATRQRVRIDLEMGCDNRRAAARDHIDDALNYKAAAKRIIAFVEKSRFQLMETLAERIAELLLREFDTPWLRLRVGKPGAVTGSQDVGVLIERGKRS